ncbi:MAG: FtsW/RodA/SpoVE family cell cycle protein, partial [Anaerolineales bacterium]
GSGGWFGQGYGHGSQVQLRFLKVRHTDFIFSAVSNEFGFVGAVVVIVLLAFVIYRIFRAGQKARDRYGALICYGIGAIVLYQSFFNIGMNMNLLPVTGLPLPFVSYGGSSLWTFLFGIGLVESVVLRHKQIEF